MGTYRLKQEFDQSRYQVDKRGSVIIVLKIKGRLYHQTIKIDQTNRKLEYRRIK